MMRHRLIENVVYMCPDYLMFLYKVMHSLVGAGVEGDRSFDRYEGNWRCAALSEGWGGDTTS